MKQKDFTALVNTFRDGSVKGRTMRSVLLISACVGKYTASLYGSQKQIKEALTTVMVEVPILIKIFDGACRAARAIIKQKAKNEVISENRGEGGVCEAEI